MSPGQMQDLARARAVQARGTALPPEGLPGPDILDSWARCLASGLDCRRELVVPVVPDGDLARRRERSEYVRRLAQAEMETLGRQIAGSNFLLAFADREGVILDLFADNRFSMSDSSAAIVAGSCWTEAVAGTNGLGTALQAGHSVAVTGLEHYYLSLGGVSCTATPLHDAAGEVVGALDASSYFEARQRHTQALVQMAATHIENGLFTHQMREHLVLAVHPRAEFLSTLSAGLLAFDGEGRLAAVNLRGRQLLQGLAARPGTAFEALFGESFERVLARLSRGSELLRLRDAMGSSLVGRGLSPLPARAMPVGQPLHATGSDPSDPVPGGVGDNVPRTGPLQSDAGRPDGASAHRLRDDGEPAGVERSAHRRAGAWRADALRTDGHRADAHGAETHRAGTRPPPVLPHESVLDDPAVRQAYAMAERALRWQVPVLIQGETGTGKELLARHLHRISGRAGPFVAVNCAALPAELVEAELFGYVGGAFTGARREGSVGMIASADGGTLLLDELRELPLALQATLLRFLDDRTVRPVGGTRDRRVDVLLLAATHGDLDDEVAARRFRADRLYRLNTVRVELPPLRRRSDLVAVVRQQLAAIDPLARLDDAALALLGAQRWGGNFRELRAVLTRALLAGGPELGAQALRAALPAAAEPAPTPSSALQQSAAELVRREFQRSGGSVSETARRLGISRTTVYRHLRGVPRPGG